MTSSIHKLNSIQALRAVAVVLVIYAHSIDSSIEIFGASNQSNYFYLENWGAIGLDLFFVISGFIMTRIIHSYQKIGEWKLFAYKRALRIIPLYWGLSLVAALLTLRTYWIKLATIKKTILFFPIFETKFEFPIIGVGWSLSYEIYFYLIISLLLLFQLKNPQTKILFVLGLLTLIGIFAESATLLVRFLSSPLLLEFALGVSCGIIYDNFKKDNIWYRVGMFISLGLGVLLMISSIFWGYGGVSEAENITNSNWLACCRSLIWGVPCALFLLGSVLVERVYSVKIPSLLIRVGDASYSSYLLHSLIINFGHKTILKLNLNADNYIIFLVILCTGLSIIMYQLIEKPLMEQLNRNFFPKKLRFINHVKV